MTTPMWTMEEATAFMTAIENKDPRSLTLLALWKQAKERSERGISEEEEREEIQDKHLTYWPTCDIMVVETERRTKEHTKG